jgi:transcriptional regulator GlxA family with amidase domain
MLWIFPKQEHVLFDWSHDFSMWVLVFKPKLVRSLTSASDRRILRSADPGEIFSRQIEPRQLDVLDQIFRDAMQPDADPDHARVALSYALTRSWQTYQFSRESIPRTDVHPAVAKAARLLSLTDDPIPLDDLAAKSGLSPARLSRLFKQQTGINITAFRQQECLKRFMGLYRDGARYSLIEAALLAGFGSYPQFHRVFQRIMGQNPASYRKGVKSATFTRSSR